MATSKSIDRGAFRAFEHAGWENVAIQYHDAFASLTTQSIGPLLDAVSAGSGVRLLDVASGPGYVVAAAAERGARADRKSTRLNSSHIQKSRMPSSA